MLCFVVVTQSFIMNSHEVFIHIHQGCFAGTGAIVRLPQCQWSKPDGYGTISQCITTTKHSKAKTVCIFLGIYCSILAKLKVQMRGASCWEKAKKIRLRGGAIFLQNGYDILCLFPLKVYVSKLIHFIFVIKHAMFLVLHVDHAPFANLKH